jgi:hypothetical protein
MCCYVPSILTTKQASQQIKEAIESFEDDVEMDDSMM